MMRKLDEQLAALKAMNTVELRAEWRRVWKSPAPPLGHDLLRRGIAWKLQEKVHGGFTRATLKEIGRLSRLVEQGKPLVPDRAAKPGTRLVREWHGKVHIVVVLDEGYLFEDRNYGSLTQIATAITGVKWSGPRFFGLTHRAKAEVVNG